MGSEMCIRDSSMPINAFDSKLNLMKWLGGWADFSIFDETHQFQRRLMRSTPNDHIYYLPMSVRVENGVKYRQQMKPVHYTRPEPKSGSHNTVNSMLHAHVHFSPPDILGSLAFRMPWNTMS